MRQRNQPHLAWKSPYLVFGLLFEATADAQMAVFKARSPRADDGMDRGLWRYSRHPNDFGESCLWWGMACLAAAAGGAWWAWLSPVWVTSCF